MSKIFKLFANCIPVKGVYRSTVCDLQNGDIFFIPNDLFDILEKYKNVSLDEQLKGLGEETFALVKEFYDFFIEKNIGFFTNNPAVFSDLSMEWDTNSIITNAIIEIDNLNEKQMISVATQLSDLGCQSIELRNYLPTTCAKLSAVLAAFDGSRIRSISAITQLSEELNIENLTTVMKSHPRLTTVSVYGAAKDETINLSSLHSILYKTKKMTSKLCCGEISTQNFSSNIPLFTESQKFNSCLNRKVAIDLAGNIKNCPSMSTSFGNIENIKIADVVGNADFTKTWKINKDQINICKGCEFRYVCLDCRAYLEDPADQLSKPLKCGYDPATTEWSEWSDNPVKQKAIKAYEMESIIAVAT